MISDESLLGFCRDLSAAVRSGLPLSDAFETLARSRGHGGLIAGAARLTAGGSMLHEALAAGADHLYLHQVPREQRRFIDVFGA
ncbi:MAG: type II secretion system F family protein, partial [Elusimicrobiales bacterium]|nr:type II secretion system F family protein [Elusimicrobiales bacterium]